MRTLGPHSGLSLQGIRQETFGRVTKAADRQTAERKEGEELGGNCRSPSKEVMIMMVMIIVVMVLGRVKMVIVVVGDGGVE